MKIGKAAGFNLLALAGAALFLAASSAHAVLVTSIPSLNIGGTDYMVTFHDPSLSFDDLWDADSDGVFGNDSSLLPSAPTFLNDSAGALQAAQAIITALGATDTTTLAGHQFWVPFDLSIGLTGFNSVGALSDLFDSPTIDGLFADSVDSRTSGRPYVSFQTVMSPGASVPEPASLALLALGCVALGSAQLRGRRNG